MGLVEDFRGDEADIGGGVGEEIGEHGGFGEGVVVEDEGIGVVVLLGVAEAEVIAVGEAGVSGVGDDGDGGEMLLEVGEGVVGGAVVDDEDVEVGVGEGLEVVDTLVGEFWLAPVEDDGEDGRRHWLWLAFLGGAETPADFGGVDSGDGGEVTEEEAGGGGDNFEGDGGPDGGGEGEGEGA